MSVNEQKMNFGQSKASRNSGSQYVDGIPETVACVHWAQNYLGFAVFNTTLKAVSLYVDPFL